MTELNLIKSITTTLAAFKIRVSGPGDTYIFNTIFLDEKVAEEKSKELSTEWDNGAVLKTKIDAFEIHDKSFCLDLTENISKNRTPSLYKLNTEAYEEYRLKVIKNQLSEKDLELLQKSFNNV